MLAEVIKSNDKDAARIFKTLFYLGYDREL